mmetsp:Transcript_29634/g.47832  ORF Transcript_29634/g.47832 Transcript_29634/m.47832 type:complete len:256 (-) Transcript_29634:1045-1812(-)
MGLVLPSLGGPTDPRRAGITLFPIDGQTTHTLYVRPLHMHVVGQGLQGQLTSTWYFNWRGGGDTNPGPRVWDTAYTMYWGGVGHHQRVVAAADASSGLAEAEADASRDANTESVVRRRRGESNSTRRPASSTMILSLSKMVSRRCAIVMTVQFRNLSRMVCCIRASVSGSMLAVASSSTRIFGFFSSTLHRHISCLCPTLKLSPPSATVACSSPASPLTTPAMLTVRRLSHSCSSEYCWKGSRLSRTVPAKRVGS